MQRMVRKWQRFLRNDDGPTAVEYAVLLALILLVCLAAVRSFGSNTNALFTKINNSIGS
jgi:pilus assembly protein Flp/PilA